MGEKWDGRSNLMIDRDNYRDEAQRLTLELAECEESNAKFAQALIHDDTDVAWGRKVRLWAANLEVKDETAALGMTGARLLLNMAVQANATQVTVGLDGFTFKSEPHGDWLVSLTRKDAEASDGTTEAQRLQSIVDGQAQALKALTKHDKAVMFIVAHIKMHKDFPPSKLVMKETKTGYGTVARARSAVESRILAFWLASNQELT